MRTIKLILLCVASICIYGCSSKDRFTITVNSFEEIDNYFDKDGAFKYEQDIVGMSEFSEGYSVVTYDGGIYKGYIDTTGKLITPYEKFDEAHPFSEGLARIKKDHKYGYINTNGEIVIPCAYLWADDFSHGLASVGSSEWCVDGFINDKGEMVIINNYGRTRRFSEGLAAVEKDGLWGYINTKGELVIPHQFAEAHEFSDGLAQVMYKDRRWGSSRSWDRGYINTKGEVLIKNRGTRIYHDSDDRDTEYFSNGFIRDVMRGRIGYLNTKGETVIPYRYEQASIFTNGYAFVETREGKKGFINTQGEMVCEVPSNIDLKNIDLKKVLQDGYCLIYDKDRNKYGYMNIKGEILGGKCQYSWWSTSFSNGFATAEYDYKRDGNNYSVCMILDKNGKHIIPLCRKR